MKNSLILEETLVGQKTQTKILDPKILYYCIVSYLQLCEHFLIHIYLLWSKTSSNTVKTFQDLVLKSTTGS